jgi:hypothetical protein
MIAIWHFLVHVTGCDYGLPYGHFGWYNLHSGFLGVVTGLSIFGGIGSLRARARRHHEAAMAQAERHHQERLDQADRHHEALKQHIASHLGPR